MTTQELKQQIDKVLGNSIRCLLPSYWWKRLFNQVADRIDDVEQSTSQLIDSKVEEVKMPIVESVDELSKLNLPKGGVAAVEKVGEPVIVNYEDFYISLDYVNDWDKYTIIKGVGEIGEVPSDAAGGFIPFAADKYNFYADTLVVGIEDGKRVYGKYLRSGVSIFTLDEVNEYLASGRYRLVGGYLSDRIAQYFTFYSAFPQPSLYIKGDSWEMLTKENVVNSEDELDGLSVPYGSIAKVNSKKYGKINPFNCYRITSQPSSDTVKRNWDKLKRITQIDVINPDAEPSTMPTIYLHGYANFGGDLIQISYYQGYKFATGSSSSATFMSLDELNSLLKNSDYRLLMILDTAEHREFFDKYVSLYSPDFIVPNAYIKGDSWTRLLKEGEVTGGDSKSVLFYMPLNNGLSDIQKQTNAESYRKVVEGFNNNRYYDVKVDCLYCIADATIVANALLTEGRIALMFDMLNTWQVMEVLEDGSATVEEEVAGKGCEIREFYTGDSLTDEQKAWNLETAMMVEENKCTTIFKVTESMGILPAGTTIPLSAFVGRTFLYVFSSGVNAAFVSITIDSNGNSDITAESVSADAAMSSTSTNAVQNKVVTAALNTKADKSDIKTINGVSLLGGGNLQLGEGVSEDYVNTAIANAITTTLNTEV